MNGLFTNEAFTASAFVLFFFTRPVASGHAPGL
jgi:hypothetical protein